MIISFDMDGTIADMNFDNAIWFVEIPTLYSQKHNISFEKAKKICTAEYGRVGDEDLRWYDIKFWLEHFELKKRYEDE